MRFRSRARPHLPRPLLVWALIGLGGVGLAVSTTGVPGSRPQAEGAGAEWAKAMELVKAGDAEAIPALRALFGKTSDKRRKQMLAAMLVTLGVQDELYFKYLADFARRAVVSDMPSPLNVDDAGNSVPGEYSADFLSWCEATGVDPHQAAVEALRTGPGDILMLGKTGDERAFELLLEGLGSPNPLVAANAAVGLGWIGDRRAIAPILASVDRQPGELALWFARALLLFENPEADAAARRLLPDEALFDELRRAVAAEKAQVTADKAKFSGPGTDSTWPQGGA